MLVPVILCGGAGSRLWPVSRKSFPKQFVNLIDNELSLLQITTKRLDLLDVKKSGWVVMCNNEHRFLVADQLSQVGADVSKIILEPVVRNTAPAIALAALEALKLNSEAKLLVQTSDHLLPDVSHFCNVIKQGLSSKQALLTFGVKPTSPETGYGYIEIGSKISNSKAYKVRRFVEKPDIKNANAYIQSGNFFWNSGMFLLDAKTYLEELESFSPDIFCVCKSAVQASTQDMDFLRIDKEVFSKCPSNSIDYAVMEKSKNVSMIPLETSWSDLGSWDAILEALPADNDGNVTIGDSFAINTKNTLIRSERRLVATLGVKDLLITETPDVVLVASKSSAQDVKSVVDLIRSQNRLEADEHVVGYRPWGTYESILHKGNFKVKEIIVYPGKALSLQMHNYRAEHWVVVEGIAEIINGDQTIMLSENESTFIPVKTKHRLSNPGKKNLILIEVQCGSYLEEDDIIRFKDRYGRN